MANLKRRKGLLQKLKYFSSYLNPKEIGIELAGTVLFAAVYDFIGHGIDNPIPNLANGMGTISGLYCIGSINDDEKGAYIAKRKNRAKRAFVRSMVYFTLATAGRIALREKGGLEGSIDDIFSNTIRYVGGFLAPFLFCSIDKRDDGGDGGDEE